VTASSRRGLFHLELQQPIKGAATENLTAEKASRLLNDAYFRKDVLQPSRERSYAVPRLPTARSGLQDRGLL